MGWGWSGLRPWRRAERQMRGWRGRRVVPVKDSPPHICHSDRPAGRMDGDTDRQTAWLAGWLAGWLPDARPTCGCGLDLLVKLCHLLLHPSSHIDFLSCRSHPTTLATLLHAFSHPPLVLYLRAQMLHVHRADTPRWNSAQKHELALICLSDFRGG